MKRQCHVTVIYLSWVIYAAGLILLAGWSAWAMCAVWFVSVPFFEWLYITRFETFAPLLGYGRIVDHAADKGRPVSVNVVVYTALGCPFCPLMQRRVEQLSRERGFQFDHVDVTLKPSLLSAKGIRSVPAIEVRGRIYCGLLTTKEVALILDQSSMSATV